MRSPTRIIRKQVERLSRLPRPTSTGVAYIGAAAVVGILLLAHPAPALLLVFGLLLSGIILSLVLPVLNLRSVVIERVLPPSVHAGEWFTVRARLTIEGRRSPAFGVVLADGPDGPYARPGVAMAVRIRRDEGVPVRYRVRIKDRGRRVVASYRLASRFPFGLFEYGVTRTLESEILVFPRLGSFRADPLPGSRFSRRMTTGETVREKGQEEFRNIREYRSGDNPRLISWKATARYRELMVKELEDDLTKRVTIFLETRLPENAASWERLRLERAISFTVSLALRLARRRYLVHLYYFGPEPAEVSGGKAGRSLHALMERLALLEPTSTGTMRDLLSLAPEMALVRSLPVLIFPETSEARLREALAGTSSRTPPVTFHMDGEWERSVFGYHDDPFEKSIG